MFFFFYINRYILKLNNIIHNDIIQIFEHHYIPNFRRTIVNNVIEVHFPLVEKNEVELHSKTSFVKNE